MLDVNHSGLETKLPLEDVTEKVGGYRLVWSGVFFVTFVWVKDPIQGDLSLGSATSYDSLFSTLDVGSIIFCPLSNLSSNWPLPNFMNAPSSIAILISLTAS